MRDWKRRGVSESEVKERKEKVVGFGKRERKK